MFKKITRKRLDLFLKNYATDSRVLDLGSGGSSYGKYFPNRLTVDIDPLRKPDVVADAHNLPFKDGEFEIILSTEMLEHVQDPFLVEKELRRCLKPGGLLLLSTRFVFPIHDSPHDYWRFTKYGLERLFRGWDILELKSETQNFSAIGVLIQRICFQSKLRGNKITKFFLLLLADLMVYFDWLTVAEFGDIKKESREKDIMATGYYLACKKRI